MRITTLSGLVLLLLFGSTASSSADDKPEWSVLIYGGVDSSAEAHIMPHLRSLGYLSRKGQHGEVLLLIDRAPGHTEDAKLLGENFEDTRLFRLADGKWNRVSGGEAFPEITLQSTFEANTGDAHTLRKFIRFGKQSYPAKKYALIVFGHGECRSVCPDMSNKSTDSGGAHDSLFVAELTEVLGQEESVDLIWFDVCSFGAIENAYQLRPGNGRFSTKAMVATPPISSPAPMRQILKETGILGRIAEGKELPLDGVSFGQIVVRVTQERLGDSEPRESWGCYDLTAVETVKLAVDRLAVALASEESKEATENIRGSGATPITMNYLHGRSPRAWQVSAHFDLYDLARRIEAYAGFSGRIRQAAAKVADAVDTFVVASLGGDMYPGFEGGKNGVYIIFPDGDAKWKNQTHWATFSWYHPDDSRDGNADFGNYSWCRDGATRDNGVVENWFELLDSWFDEPTADGGVNRYRW